METLLGLGALVVIVIIFFVATRKRPNRRYDEKAPGRAEADLDEWGSGGY